MTKEFDEELYSILKNASNIDYKDDYYKMQDLVRKMLSEIDRLNRELNKTLHTEKWGAEFIYEDSSRVFRPLGSTVIGITHKGQRPEKFTLNVDQYMIERWIKECEYALKDK